ncbi:acetolactate synthase small subunit [Propionivibrio limicola]|uniref:acetolactate synthase small subunit n=1 Tax=Propionivibrio limicola TaxID=167645 RepID=UPI001291C936|nr:acetolactate synthase small subunit [Propionivibrio limicola]
MNSVSPKRTVLELTVNNHPGVMSHVVGLFSRRAFNVEGILCLPVGNGDISRIWLLVDEDGRLPQMIRQIEKLYDVKSILRRQENDGLFDRLEELFTSPNDVSQKEPQ